MNAIGNLPADVTENAIPCAPDAPDITWAQFTEQFPLMAARIEKDYHLVSFEALMEADATFDDGTLAVADCGYRAVRAWRVYSRERAIKFLADRAAVNAPWVEKD
jgi:hypothetical protein